jgi:hypothetical protein
MPLIRKLEPGLWEVRSDVDLGIARVVFTELAVARQRLADLQKE